jgi:hypothetical protein
VGGVVPGGALYSGVDEATTGTVTVACETDTISGAEPAVASARSAAVVAVCRITASCVLQSCSDMLRSCTWFEEGAVSSDAFPAP